MAAHDTELDGLIDEHRQMITIIAALRRAVGKSDSEVEGLLDQLERALAHHTEREESGLFHSLHSVEVPAEYLGLFEHDHGHLVDLLQSARRDRQSVEGLLRSLEAHMEREEADMFPAAEQILGPADWDAIETAVAQLR